MITIPIVCTVLLSVVFLGFLFRSRRDRHELIGLHLIIFVLEMLIYGSLWIGYTHQNDVTDMWLLFVLSLLCVYIASTLWIGRCLRWQSGKVFVATLSINDKDVAFGLGLWLGLKVLLYASYGNEVLVGLGDRVAGGVPRLLVDVDRFLLLIAWGAYYTYAIRIRPHNIVSTTGILLILFLIENLFFENAGAGKRLLISTGVLIVYVRADTNGLTLRRAVAIGLLACTVLLAVNYYEEVRENFARLASVQHDGTVTLGALEEALIPRQEHNVVNDLQIREAPLWLLYALSMEQSEGTTAGGQVAQQVLANLVPGGMGDKHFEDEDSVIAEVYNFPEVDLGMTVVGAIQSELSVAAYVVTPALYVFLFWMYGHWLSKRQLTTGAYTLNSLEIMALLGAMFTTALSIQSGLTELLERLRDVIGILGIGWLGRFYWTGKNTRLYAPSISGLEGPGIRDLT